MRRFINIPGCPKNLTSDYATEVLTESPVAYWQCQECRGNLEDSSGNGYTMVYNSGLRTYRTPETPLTETDTYSIDMAGGASWDTNGSLPTTVRNNFSLEFWIKLADPYITTNDNAILYVGQSGSNGWGVLFDSDDTFQALAGGVGFLGPSSAISRDAWHHIVVVRDAGTWKYYIDGSQDGGSKGTTNPNAPGDDVFIGGDGIQRRICHMAIYDIALSSTQVSDHYNAA